MSTFTRLVRFLAKDGQIYYGDAILPSGVSDIAKATKARVIQGDIFGQYRILDQVAEIKLLLAPLARKDIGTVRCLGLNYEQHAKESNLPIPKYPVLFFKPLTSISAPGDDIPVPQIAQEGEGLDYESKPLNMFWVMLLAMMFLTEIGRSSGVEGSGGLGKGFDGWAPFGPGIVSSNVIADPNSLHISTKLNGQTVQSSSTRDMIFGVAKTIAFLSQGTTLLPGDLIFTGTPQGVGMGRKPALWLKDGDQVEVSLEGVGSCTNRVVFEKPSSKL
ncbi:hypothetical protein N7508_004517 [Penicillium antarcticum]|uniref:uncharacterized protein n=1 Tax=Penicillium antarcticum TaxID=416450 RepID=UPI0023962854|nr:uncharacterized protein N7508_004517 [Penicillium antarcticum]KAJ5309138.1 hypothetical protein N7508_004517 [Penicillium antarcticum]